MAVEDSEIPGYSRPDTEQSSAIGRVDRVVLVLLDSLNRHMLGGYGGDEFETPTLDRLASESIRFRRHFTGSLPCMPARHDILVGALDFLWRPWGSIELWETPLTRLLSRAGVSTMLITDHPHLFESGGENYHTDFSAWDYLRGHESDPWRSCVDPSYLGEPALPALSGGWYWQRQPGMNGFTRGYDLSRTYFRSEEDFPGPKTMRAAADWITNQGAHLDRFFLLVDEFDPHEPFDTPMPWANKYGQSLESASLIWPPYQDGAMSSGQLTAAEGQEIRANYGSKLSMIDHHLGKLLDALDGAGLSDSTAVIVCTDHGHYLGERREGRDIWGKPAVAQFEPLAHIPLLVRWPGANPRDCEALSTTVDLFATICDNFAVEAPHQTHGRSLLGVVGVSDRLKSPQAGRDWVLGGVFGSWVMLTDGQHKIMRAPHVDGFPMSVWSNRWSTMPLHGFDLKMLPDPDDRAYLDYMPGSAIPVMRQPFVAGDMLPLWASGPRNVGRDFCFDLVEDPNEEKNLTNESVFGEMLSLLREALLGVAAPDEQFERLGL